MFKGIEDKDFLRDFGYSDGGAEGFKLDRAYIWLGSSENIQIIAQSENHSSSFFSSRRGVDPH
jgi:N,N-dimethylformamidase